MEDSGERGLEHVTNIQLMIILNNQEIKANEQYIFYKKAEIDKLSAQCDDQKKEIAALEEKYLSLTSARIQSENSLSISNECLKTMSDHIIVRQQEKEELEKRNESLKNKYADTIKEFNEEYEKMRKEYEENTPGYKKLKELQEKNTQLEAEINVLNDNIETEKKIKEESKEIQKREFYNAIVQFAETVLSYKKNKETFMLCKRLEKEEIQLLRKYSELEKQNLFKRNSFVAPKVPPSFQMPQLKFQSLSFSRTLLNTNTLPIRKYSLLQNEKSNHKGIIEGMKRRIHKPPADQCENKRLNTSQKSDNQFDTSPYFQKLSSNSTFQKVQNQNNHEHDSFNKNHGNVKVIDVTVIPPSPATFNNTILNKNEEANNNTFIQKAQHVPLSSYNSNNERGQFKDPQIKFDNKQPKTNSSIGGNKVAANNHPLRTIHDKNVFSYQKSITSTENQPTNSQDLFFSQESVTNQLKDSQTGLTPEMLHFKIPPGNNKICSDENKENDEVQCEDQGAENESFVYNEGNCARSLNNSFNIPTFRYENTNNNSIFGQFDKPNEISHFELGDVSNQLNGIEMQHYMDTGNENYVCSPINSFLLNSSDGKEGDKDENKNRQPNNFSFKFGESTSNNGPSGQKKLFDLFY